MTDIYWALIDVAYGGPHSVTLVHCPYSYFGLIPTQGGGIGISTPSPDCLPQDTNLDNF